MSGAGGFIGARLVQRLADAGCQVTALVRPHANLSRVSHLLDRIDVIEADITELQPRDLERLRRTPVVFHLAAAGMSSPDLDPPRIVDTNATGTLRMLEAACELGCGRFVYCGSCHEYGSGAHCSDEAALEPVTCYGASKAAGWLLARLYHRRYGLPVVGLRPFNVYGPQQPEHSLVGYVIAAALRSAPIALTGGEQRRDFVYVEDVVDGFIRSAVAADVSGEAFNLCSGRAISIADLVEAVLNLMGSEQVPLLGALEYSPTDVPVLSGDPGKAERRLGWTARTSLRDGLLNTIQWHRGDLFGVVGDELEGLRA